MMDHSDQTKILALAIYEIRTLLSSYLGSNNSGDLAVRQAAHLAYALHNQALAVIDGESFNVADSMARLDFIDKELGGEFGLRFKNSINKNL